VRVACELKRTCQKNSVPSGRSTATAPSCQMPFWSHHCDPAGSQWWDQNGIWQDGAVAVERPDGTLFFWQVRFNSQATRTDSAGHPV